MNDPCGHRWLICLTESDDESELFATFCAAVRDQLEHDGFHLLLGGPSVNLDKLFCTGGNCELPRPNLDLDTLLPALRQGEVDFGQWLILPLSHRQRHFGLLVVEKEKGCECLRCLETLMSVFANQLYLVQQCRTDSLTGLLNRHTFEYHLLRAQSRHLHKRLSNNEHHPYLALFDIDHFKLVNDRFGHLIGDEVLLHFSQIMQRCFRDDDLLFRYGGEEFAVLLYCRDDHSAEQVLERFRQQVSSYPMPQVEHISCSIGVLAIGSDVPLPMLLDAVDSALYRAKDEGRNCLRWASLDEKNVGNDVELF